MKREINSREGRITAHHVFIHFDFRLTLRRRRGSISHLLRTHRRCFQKAITRQNQEFLDVVGKKEKANVNVKEKAKKKNRDDEGSVEAENCENVFDIFQCYTCCSAEASDGGTHAVTFLAAEFINNRESMEWWTGSPQLQRLNASISRTHIWKRFRASTTLN